MIFVAILTLNDGWAGLNYAKLRFVCELMIDIKRSHADSESSVT